MKIIRNVLILFTILLLIVSVVEGVLIYLVYTNPQEITIDQERITKFYTSSKTELDRVNDLLNSVPKQPKPINDVKVTGWIPDWDIPDGLEAVRSRPNTFDSISPVWYFVNSDGSLAPVNFVNGPSQRALFSEYNIKVIPAIQEFDAENLYKVLNSPENMQRHIDAILDEVVSLGFDGIDLDYESTYLKDKHLFFEFLEKLSSRLRAENKELIFTVLPKWGIDLLNGPKTLIQTRRVQDYKRIADLVDEFRIMSYEYSYPGSLKAGPIAPLEWMEEVIQYTIQQGVPREKIMLGVHNYVYDWPERELLDKVVTTEPFLDFTTPAMPTLEPANVFSLISINSVKESPFTEEFNEEWGEMILRYNYEGKDRIVAYMTNRSIELRKQLAAEYGLKGIAIWKIGDEGNLNY
jgi:spore germination protein YaaH